MYEKVVVQVEVVENWKSLDSHVKFVNGYLREFSAMKISKGNVVVKGLVSLFVCLAQGWTRSSFFTLRSDPDLSKK